MRSHLASACDRPLETAREPEPSWVGTGMRSASGVCSAATNCVQRLAVERQFTHHDWLVRAYLNANASVQGASALEGRQRPASDSARGGRRCAGTPPRRPTTPTAASRWPRATPVSPWTVEPASESSDRPPGSPGSTWLAASSVNRPPPATTRRPGQGSLRPVEDWNGTRPVEASAY